MVINHIMFSDSTQWYNVMPSDKQHIDYILTVHFLIEIAETTHLIKFPLG